MMLSTNKKNHIEIPCMKLIEIGPLIPDLTKKAIQEYFKNGNFNIEFPDVNIIDNHMIGLTNNPSTYHQLTELKTEHIIKGFTIWTRSGENRFKDYKNRVLVVKIPPVVLKEEFEEFFACFGKVLRSSISLEMRNSEEGPFKIGFVDFERVDIAKNVIRLKSLYIRKRKIYVKKFRSREKIQGSAMKKNSDNGHSFEEGLRPRVVKTRRNLVLGVDISSWFNFRSENYDQKELIELISIRHTSPSLIRINRKLRVFNY